ncbi:hypothetical protein HW555_012481, partial [Spodoptera exigua]
APIAACDAALGPAAAPDDFEPQREERPGGPRAAGRAVQRPRYYSTELGMRGSLLTGVLSSEEALKSQIAALNRTTASLQPALKFFITASAVSSVPGMANVVGFTDTREMLKPFHALKYLADNYLEEYDFFFLVSDTSYVNAQRLTELVSQLSVSEDIYMGTIAEDDSHYCSLEAGILLSNSVLRAVHAELDWCVRNSYSAHHHENIGRCVLHAARRACADRAQGVVFDHLRWVTFNATHAFFPDDHHEVARITGAHRLALDLVLHAARSWAARRWGGAEPELLEGAWLWEPARALRYRLLMRDGSGGGPEGAGRARLRLLEVARPLGAARLLPVRYVTESARLTLLVAAPPATPPADLRAFLARYEAVCLTQDKNTALILVIVGNANETTAIEPIRAEVEALRQRHSGATLTVLDTPGPAHLAALPEYDALLAAEGVALTVAAPHTSRDALLLVLPPHAEFNQDFLNRVRMNTISGEQWYLPAGFARHSLYSHPRFVAPGGGKPQVNTGRFNLRATLALAFYRSDYDAAAGAWRGAVGAPPAAVLARAPLRALRAPEPALVLAPRPPPCALREGGAPSACARALRDQHFATLDVGARHSLAQLLLETQAELDQ